MKKRILGSILAVLFAGILTGCSEAAAPSVEDVKTEDTQQSGQAEPEESETIDDSPQDQQSVEGEETRSQVILISPDREKNETAELTDRQGNRILIGEYDSIIESGYGYKIWTSGKGSEYRDRQGKLIARTDDYIWQNLVYGAENSYILYTGSLLREGEENGKSSEEFLLTNQITPRAGLFMEFTKNGSLADRGK